MKRINPSGRRKSSKPTAASSPHSLAPAVVGALVALATALAFLPVLHNALVAWDDYETLVDHSRYRGFGWAQLSWMFTTFYMGHYQPLTWLSFAADFSIWGIDPFGFHLTNLLLHSLNALAGFFVARQVLRLVFPDRAARPRWALEISAAFAALFFALHPLRVESVAWATERRDVLSGLFYLWAIYAYLRAQTVAADTRSRRHWLAGALCLFLLSLLSKAIAITLPVVLVLLDLYPLRRIGWNVQRWCAPETRTLLREKAPFALLALLFAVLAIYGQSQAAALKSFETYGIGPRLAQALLGIGFYLYKTVVPLDLSPLYEIPAEYTFWHLPSLISGGAAVLISIILLRAKDRFPAGLVCWLYYVIVLAPVLGFAQSGPQLVADRYSYLACLSWAMLLGGILLHILTRAARSPARFRAVAASAVGALSILLALAGLTWRQCAIWRNTETLWSHVIRVDPDASFGHYNLAREIAHQGRHQAAMRHYREALRIRPYDADSRNNLGLLLAVTGQFDAALTELRRAIEVNPNYARAHYNLGRVLMRRGDLGAAETHFRRALALEPDEAEIHLALGALLARRDQLTAAGEHFRAAVRVRPDSADAHAALARWLKSQNEIETAARHYQEALRLLNARAQRRAQAPSEGAGFSSQENPLAAPQ